MHIRAENEKAFNAADFAFRNGITDPNVLAQMTEAQKQAFMNGSQDGPGALQHGRDVGNPTPKTKYRANPQTGSILDGHTLRLAQAHLAKMVADAAAPSTPVPTGLASGARGVPASAQDVGAGAAPQAIQPDTGTAAREQPGGVAARGDADQFAGSDQPERAIAGSGSAAAGKPLSGAQLEAARLLAQAKGKLTPEIEEEALRAWAENRAYIDGQGNYHLKRTDDEGNSISPSGPIAPWNRAIKSKYKSVSDFSQAAQPYKSPGDAPAGNGTRFSQKQTSNLPPQQVQVSYRPGVKGAPGLLYGNPAATGLMAHLLGGNGFDGVNLPQWLAERVARRARWELYNSAYPKDMRNELRAFADEMDHVVSGEQGASYVELAPGTPLSQIKGTAREEAFHAQQRRIGGGSDVDHIGNAAAFMKNPLADKAGDHLTTAYGYADDPDTQVAEIGAKLAAGKWEELGLSEDEAQELAYQYARALVVRHGPGVVFKLRRISPILREVFHEAGRYGAEPPQSWADTGAASNAARPVEGTPAQPSAP